MLQEEAADRAERGPVAPGSMGMADVARVDAHRGRRRHDRFQVTGDDGMVVRVEASFLETVGDPVVAVIIERPGLGRLFVAASRPRQAGDVYGPDRDLAALVRLDRVPLLPGTFSVTGPAVGTQRPGPRPVRPVLFHVDGTRSGRARWRSGRASRSTAPRRTCGSSNGWAANRASCERRPADLRRGVPAQRDHAAAGAARVAPGDRRPARAALRVPGAAAGPDLEGEPDRRRGAGPGGPHGAAPAGAAARRRRVRRGPDPGPSGGGPPHPRRGARRDPA